MGTEFKDSAYDSEPAGRVGSVFVPGSIGDKRREIMCLHEESDMIGFDGNIKWSLSLPEQDRIMQGMSDSLDHAFVDMADMLGKLAEQYGANAQVACVIEIVINPGMGRA